MLEIFRQVLGNLRANKLRSFLTMFGILWGVIAVVILSATGDGFQRGNQHLLEELGRNVAIVGGGQTSSQAGGQRAGREQLAQLDFVAPHLVRIKVLKLESQNPNALDEHEIQRDPRNLAGGEADRDEPAAAS